MARTVKREEVKRVTLALDDGSLWDAEIDEKGQVVLKTEVRPPRSSSPEPKEEEKEKEEPKPEETSAEEEEKGGSTISDMLEKLKEFEKRMRREKEAERIDQPKEVDPIPDNVKENLKDPAFRARLSSVMLDNKYDRMLKGRTRGKLDMTRLYKVPTESRSVFKQKQSRQGKQYNVMLVVDESGSMAGERSWVAAECAVFLAKAFEGININVAIIGFNAYITTRKEFTQKADYDRIYQAIGTMNFNKGAGDNNDWDALNKAYQMFDHAPEGENILIMLSDGWPASLDSNLSFIDINGKKETPPKGTDRLKDYEKDQKEHIHHLVKANKHRVKSFGVGIQQGGWQIPEHKVIDNLDDLKPAVIGYLKKNIRRG